ncbi:E5 [Cervus elaphus papillomavirus 1]|uniref:E5 n=1 Tax=Cervus elaphus papillomavirus 1 TaxID=1163699 RepID=I3RWK0_9PAPI|nr:E5 [Cervus elaphus papillomavirus 1]QIQ60729.1 E5 [Cervus elaphus papillomavirus 1]QIQ60738.1 E5 [Cervus elaphus papillomavirus 1]QNR09198.1 E5 [Cervus elaphus papillomavirus 1]
MEMQHGGLICVFCTIWFLQLCVLFFMLIVFLVYWDRWGCRCDKLPI